MIELMVVIAVLLILVGITVVGVGRFATPGKARATQLTMENLQSLLGEFEAQARQQPMYDNLDTSITPPALRAPGDVAALNTDAIGRHGHATIATQRVLRQLMRAPRNREAYGRLPAEQQMAVQWASGVTYKTGDELKEGSKYYRLTGAPTNSAPPGAGWKEVTEHQSVALDGWGNPILFVPKDGLFITTGKRVRPPSGPDRPFWASAGPDGKFTGGEDNIYSFEK